MRRGGGGRGAAAPPNSGKQWVKFGQTVGEIRAKQEEKIGQRKLQINPFALECGWWRHTGNVQGGGGACECPRVGVFFKFWEGGWRHAGNVQGGCACTNFGQINPSAPPPLTKAFPYAYDSDTATTSNAREPQAPLLYPFTFRMTTRMSSARNDPRGREAELD